MLLQRLHEAGQVVTGPTGAKDERELAEGYRHVTRLLSVGTEMLMEKGDPARPAFTRWINAYRKIYGDNPHTAYDTAVISPDHVYVVRGQRGGHCYLGLCLYGSPSPGSRRIIANIDDDELDFAPDGSFELHLGGEPRERNWLPLEADASELMVRQYFHDPVTEAEATYTIETVPGNGPPPVLTPAEVDRRLVEVGDFVLASIQAETTLSALSASVSTSVFRSGEEFVDRGGVAIDPPIDPAAIARVMPTPAIQYSGEWFDDLGDDEVLVVEGTVPPCRYLSIQLLTRWMESGEWQYHPVFLTDRDLVLDDDRAFRVLIAHTDPHDGDWLDTTGIRSGSIAVRAVKAKGTLEVSFARRKVGALSRARS